MTTIANGAAIAIACLYGIAVLAHLQHPESLKDAATAVGVPRIGVPLVPAGEVGIAVALALAPTLGGIFTLGYIGLASALFGRARLAGVDLNDCGCFGQRFSQEVGSAFFARNMVLAGLGLFIATSSSQGNRQLGIGLGVLGGVVTLIVFAGRLRGAEAQTRLKERRSMGPLVR